MKKPGYFAGALTGLLLTVPIIAVFYFGLKIFGLPFAPFDVFDLVSGLLPGPIITFSIERMVAIIRGLNLGETAVVAKAAEMTMGVIIFLVAGIVAGLIIQAVMRVLKGSYVLWAAIIAAIFAIPIMIITLMRNKTSSISPIIIAIWIFALFIAWGITFGLVYRRSPASGRQIAAVNTQRRWFLGKLAGSVAVVSIAAAGSGFLFRKRKPEIVDLPWSATHPLPNADAVVQPAPGTRPEFTAVKNHYRIDINLMPPHVDINNWRLQIKGLVNNPHEYTIDEIRAMPSMSQFVTLECISNPVAGDLISTQRWTGTSMKKFLDEIGVRPEATHLNIISVDGFHETVSLDEIKGDDRVMLTYDWDGLPLPVSHGFPLRIYIPNHYGMKQPKWIESMEAVVRSEDGYWVVRGWDRLAKVKATSVIDTIAADSQIAGPDGGMLVPVGGIAYSGARGISRVELQIDGGDWREAELRTPLSDTTWVIWRYNYPYEKGEHTFTVRCYEADGTPQIEAEAPPHPSGATGYHMVTVNI